MRRYTAIKKSVRDAGGQVLADCRSARVARMIADALNAAAPAPSGPGSVLVRRDRMKGVQVEWPAAPLVDEPRSRTKRQEEERMLANLRTDFDRRVESLLHPGAGKKLRAAIKRKRFVAEAAAAECLKRLAAGHTHTEE